MLLYEQMFKFQDSFIERRFYIFFQEIYSKMNQFSVIPLLICSWPTSQSAAFFT